jgi:hypothetical protein
MNNRELKLPINEDSDDEFCYNSLKYKGSSDGFSTSDVAICKLNVRIMLSYFYILLSGFCSIQSGYAVYKTPVDGGVLIDCSFSNLWVYQIFTISVNILFIFFEARNIKYYRFLIKDNSNDLTVSEKIDYYKKIIGNMSNHHKDEIDNENYINKIVELYNEIQCLNCFLIFSSIVWMFFGLFMLNDECVKEKQKIYLLILSTKITVYVMAFKFIKTILFLCECI